MYIKIIEIPIEQMARSKHTSKKLIVCSCDICDVKYTQKYTRPRLTKLQNQFTFCSKGCTNLARKRGGILMKQTQSNRDNEAWQKNMQSTMKKRYNVTNPGQMLDHVEKCSRTLMENYGVTNALNLPHARDNMRKALASKEVKETRIMTNLERYGHENVFASEPIKDKIKQTLQARYGINHSSRIEGISKKRKSTYAITHDYDHPFKEPKLRQFLASKECSIKKHETMKRNGTYGKVPPKTNYTRRCFKDFQTPNDKLSSTVGLLTFTSQRSIHTFS